MSYLQENAPCFENICMPGLTEDSKLSIFFHLEPYNSLKLVYVCEEYSEELLEEFKESAMLIFKEFDKKKITQTLEICENQMFQKQSRVNV